MPISHYCIAADRTLAFKGVTLETRLLQTTTGRTTALDLSGL